MCPFTEIYNYMMSNNCEVLLFIAYSYFPLGTLGVNPQLWVGIGEYPHPAIRFPPVYVELLLNQLLWLVHISDSFKPASKLTLSFLYFA
jgi:hypothetical protein